MNLPHSMLTHRPQLIHASLDDRRGSLRTRTVFRIVRVRARADEGLARIRNISDAGMRLTIGIPVVTGDQIEICMSDTLIFAGRIMWTEDRECGVQFLEQVNSIAALKFTAEETRAQNYRPPRLSASQSALVITDRGRLVAHLHDISQKGVKMSHDGSFTPGIVVRLVTGQGIERSGYVRWVDGDLAGTMLTEPFTVEELGSVRSL